jgi:hypothetical protein
MILNQICNETTNPELLNALHACRLGHPLNHPHCWINAYSIAVCQPFARALSRAAIDWLEKQAIAERRGQ